MHSVQLVSCSGDGMIYHTDIITPQETSSSCFDCHVGAVYEVLYVLASLFQLTMETSSQQNFL